jgi:hypothetical protein
MSDRPILHFVWGFVIILVVSTMILFAVDEAYGVTYSEYGSVTAKAYTPPRSYMGFFWCGKAMIPVRRTHPQHWDVCVSSPSGAWWDRVSQEFYDQVQDGRRVILVLRKGGLTGISLKSVQYDPPPPEVEN